MRIIILLVVVLWAGVSGAGERDAWTRDDTGMQVVVSGLIAADWAQTLHMARNPEQYREYMPITRAIIGEHPSEGRVNSLAASCLVLNAGIAYALPRPYRTYWQGFWIVTEGAVVARNWNVGIRLSF